MMSTNTMREKLYDYIRVAGDKKIKAIYMMLEDEITEDAEWWKNNAFAEELDRRYAAWQSGKEKAYTLEETHAAIEELKKKRKNK